VKTLRKVTWLLIGVVATVGVAPAAPLDLPVPSVLPIADPPTAQLVVFDTFGFKDEFLASVGMELSEILRQLRVHATWSPEGSVDRVGEESGGRPALREWLDQAVQIPAVQETLPEREATVRRYQERYVGRLAA